ncbi:MAG: ECF-type sigma factor [Pirellula sp.]|jgi:RNA polymerase sigma factor (TIGR02999 family)
MQKRPDAMDLVPELYAQLKRIAARKMRGESDRAFLQTTALVHEAFLKLNRADNSNWAWESDEHFLRASAQAMQRILVDHARARKSKKRGGSVFTSSIQDDEDALCVFDVPDYLPALDTALEKLRQIEPTAAELIQLRFFAGLTHAQAASTLGISLRAAERYWTYARAWLYQQIQSADH